MLMALTQFSHSSYLTYNIPSVLQQRGGAVRLHYNLGCVHGVLPTTYLRILYAAGLYAEALEEITQLDGQPLASSQRLVMNVHEVLVKLAMRRASYGQAKVRLEELAALTQELGDENAIAKLRSRRIGIAARYRDHQLATELMYHFFDDINRTPITEAHWRIAQGVSTQFVMGPAKAIHLYLMVVMDLVDANRPCLREMAARRLAFCLNALGDKRTAVEVLRHIGLPASTEPADGKIPLDDLLVLQLM